MPRIVVNKTPRDGDVHTWADYIELLAVINLDSICTVDAVLDRILDAGSVDETDDEVGSDDSDEAHDPVSPRRDRRPLMRGRYSRRIFDAFEMLAWRASAYDGAYPFVVADDKRSISVRADLGPANYVYLFLLVAANLPFVSVGRNQVTNAFEEIAVRVMRAVLPRDAEVHVFGKATAQRYSGSAFRKIEALAADIRASLRATESTYRASDSGDSGIDIVAWHGLNDKQGNIFVYFGQCACSRADWTKKQLSASPGNLAKQLATIPAWNTIMFVPICFRRVGGDWAVDSDVTDVVFFDRYRVIGNSSGPDVVEEVEAIKLIVDEVLSAKEEVV